VLGGAGSLGDGGEVGGLLDGGDERLGQLVDGLGDLGQRPRLSSDCVTPPLE